MRGKNPKTTIPDSTRPCPLDRVNRKFHAPAPSVLWVNDFTYVATWKGFVYVAFVIEVFAQRIVGGGPVVPLMQGLLWMHWSKPVINVGQRRTNSSIGAGHGAALKPSNTPPSNGSIGLTTAAC
jgi:hypothetical protein